MGDHENNRLEGGRWADTIDGYGGDDLLIGGADGDALDGGDGVDTVSYAASDAAVSINLAINFVANGEDNRATGGHATGDSLDNIENIIGSDHNDSITGNAADNVIEGGADGDNIDGAGGSDTASYIHSDAAVTIDLSTNTVSGGHATGDTLTDIENITGSSHDDILTGDAGDNVIDGGAGADRITTGSGNDILMAGDGNDQLDAGLGDDVVSAGAGDDSIIASAGGDHIDGGEGVDTISYAASGAGIDINLITGAASGGYATGDSVYNVEFVIATSFDDRIVGGDEENRF